MTINRLLTALAAAHFLNISTRNIMRLVDRDAIPHVVLPGGEVRFDPDDLADWTESKKHVPAASAG